MRPDQVDADHTGCEKSVEQESIMDFAEMEIAQQLTHMDSVCMKWNPEALCVFTVHH